MEWLIEKMLTHPLRSAAVVMAVAVIAVSGMWWQLVRQNPHTIFQDMLRNNLMAQSVTKHVVAGSSSSGVDQTVRQEMGSTSATEWLVAAHQSGASVTTDSIGTAQAGYIRYTAIANSATKAGTSFKSTLNTWAKSDGQTDMSLEQLFAQTVLDISSAPTPPIANLTADRRDALLAYIQTEQVFAPDYKKVKRETVDGRTVLTYSVAVRLGAYVRLMQTFAHDIGDSSLDTIDPNQYAAAAPLTLSMSVDTLSHQLARVQYTPSGFLQTYADWGILRPIAIPTRAITTTDLQNRLQALSKP